MNDDWRAVRRLSGSENHKGWFIMTKGGAVGECYPLTEDGSPTAKRNALMMAAAPALFRELDHLVRLLEPLERDGRLNVPGLATLNAARAALAKALSGDQ